MIPLETDRIPDSDNRWLRPVTCTVVGMLGNCLLCASKIVVGLLANSTSLVADGFHSLSDLISDIGIVIVLKASSRPPDRNHPYGHHNFETLGALGASLLLVATGVLIGRNAILNLLADEHQHPQLLAFALAVIAILVKEIMARYTYRAAVAHNSPALRANAANHRSDAFSSIAAAIGILAAILGLPFMDSVSALFISLLILKMGFDLLRENVLALLDTMPEPELLEQITASALKVPGAHKLSELRVRQRGSYYFVDVSVMVDPQQTVAAGHCIAHEVEQVLTAKIPTLVKIFVHVEPDQDQ
ncbi:MAG: cation diffusion facilitator family transporter [bacterium]